MEISGVVRSRRRDLPRFLLAFGGVMSGAVSAAGLLTLRGALGGEWHLMVGAGVLLGSVARSAPGWRPR